ncbi:MAG: putative dehydrogenase [Hyphomicrobiaceae bacterium]|jgi:predicted dehydrogenase
MATTSGPVKLGFVGFGIMGERLARAALNHDKATLTVTGVYDPSPGTADKLKSIDPSLTAFESADAVIAQSDCLHIASPPASHLQYLTQCADEGKAALCEKPLSTDGDAAAKVVSDMAKRGMRAGVNFPFASSFAVDHIQRWMSDGTVGVPERVDIDLAFAAWPRTWQMDAISWLDDRAEGGFTREVGSHFLFLSRRIFGRLRLHGSTCAYPDSGRSERTITADLHAGEMPVQMLGGTGTTEKDDHNTWTLSGTNGRVRLRDWSYAEREVDGEWQAPADALPNEQARPLILKRQLDKVAALAMGEQTNLASLEEALEVQMVVEEILKAPAS